jgi:predicted RecB family nuclease
VINRGREERQFEYDESELLAVLADIREIVNGKKVSPTYNSCVWPWESYCNQEAIKRQDVSIVGGIGPSFKEKFVTNGILKVSDLATATIPQLMKIKGIGKKRAVSFRTNATALVIGTHIKLGNITFPTVSTEIFLDLEGTGEQVSEAELVPIDYLIGVVVRKDRDEEYIPFLAKDLESEGEMFTEFLEWLTRQEDHIIYHWHNYEKFIYYEWQDGME